MTTNRNRETARPDTGPGDGTGTAVPSSPAPAVAAITDADRLRAQIPSSTDPSRLEQLARDDERRRLATFVCWALRTAFKGSDLEGAEIQERAQQLGLIVEAEGGYDPERHGDDDFAQPGDPYYELADWIKGLDRGKASIG